MRHPNSTGRPFTKGHVLTEEQKKRRTATRLANMTHGPRWKGGRRISEGYVRLWNPAHPSSDKSGYVAEHRLIAEGLIGRHLKKREIVHHINEITTDNRPENLMVLKNKGSHMRLHRTQLKKGDVIWPIDYK